VGAIVVGAALAVTGAVFAATSWSKYDSAKNGACLATNEGCGKAADAIEQRATLSKVFFAGGALLGVTGAALIIFFPASHSSRTTMAGAAWTF
jgi:ABC-type enterobactin transport system permease subunit